VTVFWTDRAFEHLAGVGAYVSRTSEAYAERVVDRLVGRSEQLAAHPYSGRIVPEYERAEVREVIERPYRVLYRVREDVGRVEVLAVLHGRRELPAEAEGL